MPTSKTNKKQKDNRQLWQQAYEYYRSGRTYQEIADMYKVSISTVRSWQQRHWRHMNNNARDNTQSDAQTSMTDAQDNTDTQRQRQTAITDIDYRHPTNTLRAVGAKQAADTMPANLYDYTRYNLPELTDKQARFVQEYLIDFNATQAVIRAGYGIKTADVTAAKLMADGRIQSHMSAMRAELARRTGLNQDIIRREVARMLLVNPADVIDLQTGAILPSASKDDLAAVQAYEVKPIINRYGEVVAYERKVRFTSKDRLVEIAAKLEGMLIDRKQVDVTQRVEEMTDDERRQRIRELQAKLAIDVDGDVIDG